MTLESSKQALRLSARTARDRIAASEREAAALAIANAATDIAALAAAAPLVVSAYLAIGSELDPAPLLERLRLSGATIALPVMVAKATPLEFRSWRPGEPLVAREWGIREPGPECPVVEPDIALVPLLLVDAQGNRLGYGGGFYDRTLNALRRRKPCIAIGVAYSSQRVDAVPHAAYDEPLDYLLTPDGLEALQ